MAKPLDLNHSCSTAQEQPLLFHRDEREVLLDQLAFTPKMAKVETFITFIFRSYAVEWLSG